MAAGGGTVEGAGIIDQIKDKKSRPTMRDINRYVVRKYCDDWEDIGIELGLELDVLDNIKKDNPHQSVSCFRKTLDKWLKLNTNDATWKTLEVAITNVNRAKLGLDPVDDVYVTKTGVSSSSTLSGPQSRQTLVMNLAMSSSMNPPGMNYPGMSSAVINTGISSGMNIGMSSGMNSCGIGPGINSRIGMPSTGMSSTNQIPPLSSGNLTGMQRQTPDVHTSAEVGGAEGPSMMNHSAQTQQTQVIWTGSIEVSERLGDGPREMRSVRCSVTAKVNNILALKPELWPPKMILQLYPHSIYTSVLQQLKNRAPITTTLVTLSFLEPIASINTLKMLTSAEQQRLGMVQLLGVPQHCPVKIMILTWNNQQFVGHVLSEQDRFLMTFRQTLQELQKQQQQLQEQMAAASGGGETTLGRKRGSLPLAYERADIADAHQQAISGKHPANQFKLVMLGAENAGKTCTVHSLLGEEFHPNQPSTVGAEVTCANISNRCTVDCFYVSNWKQKEIQARLQEIAKHHVCEVKGNMIKYLEAKTEKKQKIELNEQEESVRQDELNEQEVSKGNEILNNEEEPDGDVRIMIYDLGGQEIYYEIQFLFLASHDVVFLAFDASKSLKACIVRRIRFNTHQEKYKTRKELTTLEAIEITLQTIHSRCGKKVEDSNSLSHRTPVVVLVATHSENLKPDEKESIAIEIYKYLHDKKYLTDYLIKNFKEQGIIFIDNKTRDEKTFLLLKSLALNAAKMAIEEERPISYLNFERAVMEISKDRRVISKHEARMFAIEAGVIDTEEALLELLEFYTYKGILLYYPQVENLEDMIFILPQEVSDLISTVLCTHQCFEILPHSDFNDRYTRFDRYGLLEESLLDNILEQSGRAKDKKTILAFLKKFDLGVEVDKSTRFQYEDPSYQLPEKGRVFFVPLMLIYNETEIYRKDEGYIDNTILFYFPDKFLTDNFFNHVLVLTIRWCNDKLHHIRSIFRGIGVFDFNNGKQSFTLQLCSTTYCIKCFVSVQENEIENEELRKQRWELLSYLNSCIEYTHTSFIPEAVKPVAHVYCPVDHRVADVPPHLFLDKIKWGMSCSIEVCKKVPVEAYNLLLKCPDHLRLVECAVIIHEIPNKSDKPTEQALNRHIVYQGYAVDWREIGIELGLKPEILDTIKANHEFHSEKCIKCFQQVLHKWLQSKPTATWKELEVALTNVARQKRNLPVVCDVY